MRNSSMAQSFCRHNFNYCTIQLNILHITCHHHCLQKNLLPNVSRSQQSENHQHVTLSVKFLSTTNHSDPENLSIGQLTTNG